MLFLLLFQYFISETYEPALRRTEFYLGTLSRCHLLRQLIDCFSGFRRYKKNCVAYLGVHVCWRGKDEQVPIELCQPPGPTALYIKRYVTRDVSSIPHASLKKVHVTNTTVLRYLLPAAGHKMLPLLRSDTRWHPKGCSVSVF